MNILYSKVNTHLNEYGLRLFRVYSYDCSYLNRGGANRSVSDAVLASVTRNILRFDRLLR